LTTVIEKVPVLTRSAAGITAESWVALTNVVAMGVPLKAAVELGTKLVPVRLMVKFGLPAMADVLSRLVNVGAGLLTVKV